MKSQTERNWVCVLLATMTLTLTITFCPRDLTAQIINYDPDPGIPDTIRIGCPLNFQSVAIGDSVAVPIYMYIDDYLYGFSLGFHHDVANIEIISWTPMISAPDWLFLGKADYTANTFGIGGVSFGIPNTAIPPGSYYLGNLNVRLVSGPSSAIVDLDSSFFFPAGHWIMDVSPIYGSVTFFEIQAQFVECEYCDFAINATCPNFDIECGDFDGSGQIDVADAVYLVNYIFVSPHPEPHGACGGDANCDQRLNLGDAVYLINYFFSGGPEPGAACR